AGTTGAVLRAGLPAVVGWYSADQPMWGTLLRDAGVGVSRRASTLTRPGVLAGALAEVLDPASAARATRLADRLVPADRAVGAAADAIEGRDCPARSPPHHGTAVSRQASASASTRRRSVAASGTRSGSSAATLSVVVGPTVVQKATRPPPAAR